MLNFLRKPPQSCNECTDYSSGIRVAMNAHNRTTWRRLSDTLAARQWLAEGVPVADVLTMLEVRRRLELSPDFARAYAVEILSAARGKIHTTNQLHVAHRKEPKNAVA
ncbi:MAG: hypothetical protein ABSD70_19940 [Terracidiphilus sp.]|jgi:hypothetical protein